MERWGQRLDAGIGVIFFVFATMLFFKFGVSVLPLLLLLAGWGVIASELGPEWGEVRFARVALPTLILWGSWGGIGLWAALNTDGVWAVVGAIAAGVCFAVTLLVAFGTLIFSIPLDKR
jgi:hypothetical protein